MWQKTARTEFTNWTGARTDAKAVNIEGRKTKVYPNWRLRVPSDDVEEEPFV